MSPRLKAILNITAKQAVNAILVTIAPIVQDPKDYNLTSLHGWQHVGVLIGGAIAARELLTWIPKIAKWAQDISSDEAQL